MATDSSYTASVTLGRHRLSMLSLLELIERIVFFDDEEALRELHDHRTPCLWNRRFLSVLEYLQALSRTSMAWRRAGGTQEALEDAVSLTVEKLVNAPEAGFQEPDLKSGGPDRRMFYRECLTAASQVRAECPDLGPFELDVEVAGIVQKTTARGFRFSCLEASRNRNPLRSRFAWPVAGGTITVWMPTSMPGARRQAWLKANVKNPDPGRPGERARVQAIVDQHLGTPRHVALDRVADRPVSQPASSPLHMLIQREIGIRGLAAVVADEKADDMDRQRPTIQMLGQELLKALIYRIFSELGQGCHEEKAVAQSFGLSLSTLSRFAGSNWVPGRGARLPDLWRNVAGLLRAGCPVFVEAVEEAGLRQQMDSFLQDFATAEARRRPNAG